MNNYNPHSPLLKRFGYASIIGALFTAALIGLDPRILSGEPVWLKPHKFFISMSIFTLTLDWGLSKAQENVSRLNFYRRLVTYGLLIEIVLICTQAARGVKSHFNYATALDTAIFLGMGGVIAIVVVATVMAALLATRVKTSMSASEKAAFKWGFVTFGIAGFLGYLMPQPTALQMQALLRGERLAVIGSHFVGSEEGLTRLAPLTGWSLHAGDLRVAHFFGMHSVQLLLILVIFLRYCKVDLNSKRAEQLLQSTAALFAVTTFSFLLEAYLKQSFFSPQPEFWIFRAVVLLIIFMQTVWVMRNRERTS